MRKTGCTAIPEDPFNRRFGIRAGKREGSFCESSKLGTKSTCEINREQIKAQNRRYHMFSKYKEHY